MGTEKHQGRLLSPWSPLSHLPCLLPLLPHSPRSFIAGSHHCRVSLAPALKHCPPTNLQTGSNLGSYSVVDAPAVQGRRRRTQLHWIATLSISTCRPTWSPGRSSCWLPLLLSCPCSSSSVCQAPASGSLTLSQKVTIWLCMAATGIWAGG